MVRWKPVTGWLPPMSEAQWEEEFSAYQQTPEYQKVNSHMDIHAYKSIFVAEYIHRLLGRLLGLIFFIPFLFFALSKKLRGKKLLLYLGIGCLGGAQGLMGWVMVKSGLVDRPDVSAYRLCAHLFLGGLLYWICLVRFARENWNGVWPTSKLYWATLLAIALQICSGAFVSGTEAGHVFSILWHGGGAGTWDDSLGILNLFENVLTIMLHHSVLALLATTLCVVYALSIKAQSSKFFHSITVMLGLQILLGVMTLYFYNPQRPIALALAHQMGAFVLLAIVTLTPLGRTSPSR
jgi:heme a synthase